MKFFRPFLLLSITFFFIFIVCGQSYQDNWTSLDKRSIPQWYTDAKFGIFIHWGLYSVPAFAPTGNISVYGNYSEWYWNKIKTKQDSTNPFWRFHKNIYGEKKEYQDFVKDFKAEMFNPDQWAEIFAKSGAKYVVLTSKHHDGFALWPSPQSWNWNSYDVGPHRDIAGELSGAIKNKGLKMGFYYSLYEWYNPLYKTIEKYVDEHMLPQMTDLVNRYNPDIFWPDGEWDYPSEIWKSTTFLKWLYNESTVRNKVVVNDRWGKGTRGKHGGFYTTEYGFITGDNQKNSGILPHAWEECRAIGGSFGYNRNERLNDYSSATELITTLIKTVSEGGNLLLDVGPTADGRIPVIMEQRLMEIGKWLKVNGEAIYGTSPWLENTNKSDSNIYYTRKGNDLFVLCTGWPKDEISLKGLNLKNKTSVTLLGSNKKFESKKQNDVLRISIPKVYLSEIASSCHVFKIEKAFMP